MLKLNIGGIVDFELVEVLGWLILAISVVDDLWRLVGLDSLTGCSEECPGDRAAVVRWIWVVVVCWMVCGWCNLKILEIADVTAQYYEFNLKIYACTQNCCIYDSIFSLNFSFTILCNLYFFIFWLFFYSILFFNILFYIIFNICVLQSDNFYRGVWYMYWSNLRVKNKKSILTKFLYPLKINIKHFL
jgi:hypothetical protein